jgi:hypothetical protein
MPKEYFGCRNRIYGGLRNTETGSEQSVQADLAQNAPLLNLSGDVSPTIRVLILQL